MGYCARDRGSAAGAAAREREDHLRICAVGRPERSAAGCGRTRTTAAPGESAIKSEPDCLESRTRHVVQHVRSAYGGAVPVPAQVPWISGVCAKTTRAG